MLEAYYYREQKEMAQWRTLYTLVINIGAGKDEVKKPTDVQWLSYIDIPEEKAKIPQQIPKRLTKEEIRQQKILDGIITE